MATAPRDLAQPSSLREDRSFNVRDQNPDLSSAHQDLSVSRLYQASISRSQKLREDKSVLVDDLQKKETPSTFPARLNDSHFNANVIRIPNLFSRRQIENRSVNTLQEWEGLVDAVDGENFVARLRDLTNSKNPEEIATIPLSEVDPCERERVIPGALFHLFIGYTRRGGSQRRETFTYFRKHLPRSNASTSELADLLGSFDN